MKVFVTVELFGSLVEDVNVYTDQTSSELSRLKWLERMSIDNDEKLESQNMKGNEFWIFEKEIGEETHFIN